MLNEKYLNKVIDFAWADEISFDSIKEQTGLNEKQVIKLMRRRKAGHKIDEK